MQKNKKTLFWLILSSFLLIPLIVSVISSIHVINFFELSNYTGLAIALSVSFEIGALSALAGLVVMDKINKNVIYFIFILLTAYQMMGNTYYAYDMLSAKMIGNPNLIKNWMELFGFETDDTILMKRVIAIISGAILPIVSLCFLDLSVDYIKKSSQSNELPTQSNDEVKDDKKKVVIEEPITQSEIVENILPPTIEEVKIIDPIEEDKIIEPIENNVISEEEKKEIREKIEENKEPNTIKTKQVRRSHNLVYTK